MYDFYIFRIFPVRIEADVSFLSVRTNSLVFKPCKRTFLHLFAVSQLETCTTSLLSKIWTGRVQNFKLFTYYVTQKKRNFRPPSPLVTNFSRKIFFFDLLQNLRPPLPLKSERPQTMYPQN